MIRPQALRDVTKPCMRPQLALSHVIKPQFETKVAAINAINTRITLTNTLMQGFDYYCAQACTRTIAGIAFLYQNCDLEVCSLKNNEERIITK